MLNGWKGIAAYLNRKERTVMRWAAERDMPVHRVPGSGRGTVYAFREEIDAWLSVDRARLLEPTTTETAAPIPAGPASETPPAPVSMPSAAIASRRTAPVRWRPWAAAVAGLVAFSGIVWMAANPSRPVAAERLASSSDDPVARDLYLRGRAAWSRRTPASLSDATRLFAAAVARDPRMADAYVGLADAWLLRREFATAPEAEAWTRADAATDAALAIDPALPGAVRARGFIDFWWRRDRTGALATLRRAIALAPGDAQSYHWLATALAAAGDHDGAVREIDVARGLDPANPAILADRGLLLVQAGHVDAAVASLREVIAAYPAQSDAHASLSIALLVKGDDAGYARERQAMAALRGDARVAALYGEAAAAFAPNAASDARQSVARQAETGFNAGWLPTGEATQLIALAGHHRAARNLLETQRAHRDPRTLAAPMVPI